MGRTQEEAVNDVGLDQLLAQAANQQRRFVPGAEALKLATSLARRPRTAARHTATLAAELARVAVGASQAAPVRGDRRFSDPAWQNWLFRRILQAYLTVAGWSRTMIDEAQLDWADDQRLRIILDNLTDALAPTNFPLTNPVVLKTTVEKGGANFVAGARQALRDAASPVRLPASVDPTGFVVGETLAASPGAVVRREPMFEVLQYEARSPEVYETPILLIPPMISKFYVVDLAPGKSMVEFLGDRGVQSFALSWRNPGRQQAKWGLDEYVGAIVEAFRTVREVSASDKVHVVGFCAGGIATTCAVAHLAQIGELDSVASLNLTVTVLDMERGGPVMSMASPEAAKVATAKVGRKGYLAGTELSRTFAWLRPTEMIWNNFVNNYYLGNKPPSLDLLYWNLDSMNMPAGLHRDMLQIGLDNPLAQGEMTVLGTRLDLSEVTCDAYVVAGETDHLTPWPNCYKTTQLLGGSTRFVLSTSGHVAAVIHPPGNPRSGYWVGDETKASPDEWFSTTAAHKGTWWEDWAAWLSERSGPRKEPPAGLGSARYQPVGPAPGEYVLHRS